MSVPYPPFAGLRAFEAAARHRSFRRAAEELNLTESAVSHEIRRLESWFGLQLFLRERSGLVLTKKAVQLFDQVHDSLGQLAAVTTRLRCIETQTLTLSVLPTFAANWLIPRLSSFERAQPTLEVRLHVSRRVVDLNTEAIDGAIRYGSEPWPNLHCDLLIEECVFPVCSPALLTKGGSLRHPSDLNRFRLLHDSRHGGEWERWLAAVHAKGVDVAAGHKLESSALLLRAAAQGLGVALGRRPLVDVDLESGALVAPFGTVGIPDQAYFFVCTHEAAAHKPVATFREWLLAAVRDGKSAPAPGAAFVRSTQIRA
jgi:LysR family glycine cleavage system transcriptional activator